MEYYGPEYLVSALVAEVARCTAAGCTAREITAYLELEDDADAKAAAATKRDALAKRLDDALDEVIASAAD